MGGPNTTEQYAKLYDEAYKDVFSQEAFFDIMLNGLREHMDRLDHVCSKIRELAPESILDMPCGWGWFGGLVRWQRGYSPKTVVGVDVSDTIVDFCMKRMRYDHVLKYDLTTPLDLGRKFDLVLCMEMLEHVHDPKTVIANALRHAGKHVLFSTPVEDGDVDGEVHVRHVENLVSFIGEHYPQDTAFYIEDAWFLESKHGEKPHWKGWNFALLGRKA